MPRRGQRGLRYIGPGKPLTQKDMCIQSGTQTGSKCTRKDTHKHQRAYTYTHVHGKRLSNVMSGDRLSALLRSCFTATMHSAWSCYNTGPYGI